MTKSVYVPENSEECLHEQPEMHNSLEINKTSNLSVLVLPKRKRTAVDDDGLVAGDPPPRIPPGEYYAVCTDFKLIPSYRGVEKLVFSFTVHGGQYDGTKLAMFCTKPPSAKKMHRHKLYREWSIAIGRFPRKGDRATKKTFVNRLYRVQVVLTKKKYPGGRLYPDHLQTSVVQHIISIEA